MSASRERKKRMQEPQQAAPVKETRKKLSEGWIFTICVALVVVLVFGCLFGYRAYNANRTVLTVGEHKVSANEFNYYYNSAVSVVSSYPSFLSIDTTVSLDKQKVADTAISMLGLFGIDAGFMVEQTPVNGYYDMTWAQFFAHVAMENAAGIYAIYDEAMANGFTLTDSMKAEVEENIEQMRSYADTNGESLNSLLARVYGTGCDEDGYRDFLTKQVIASYYPNEVTYSSEELAARYEESPETYDVASYYYFKSSNTDFVEEDEEGNTPEPTTTETALAKEAAQAMVESFDLENESVVLKADSTRSAVTSLISENAANWLFDEAANGEVMLFAEEGTFYVLKLIDKSNYRTVNALELVIEADHTHEEGEELDHVHEEGELTAAEKLEQVKAALDANATEETFLELAAQYSSNDEAEIKNMTRSTMASVSDEILAWSMEDRKAGDYGVFEVDGATLVLLYTGEGMSYTDAVVNAVLVNEYFTELTEAAAESCNYDEAAAMHAKVNLILTGSTSSAS